MQDTGEKMNQPIMSRQELEDRLGRELNRQHTGNKYRRTIKDLRGEHANAPRGECVIDVYSVLVAFNVTNPGIQHAVKKLLCGGMRGKNDTLQDYKEAIDAISRAIQIEEGK